MQIFLPAHAVGRSHHHAVQVTADRDEDAVAVSDVAQQIDRVIVAAAHAVADRPVRAVLAARTQAEVADAEKDRGRLGRRCRIGARVFGRRVHARVFGHRRVHTGHAAAVRRARIRGRSAAAPLRSVGARAAFDRHRGIDDRHAARARLHCRQVVVVVAATRGAEGKTDRTRKDTCFPHCHTSWSKRSRDKGRSVSTPAAARRSNPGRLGARRQHVAASRLRMERICVRWGPWPTPTENGRCSHTGRLSGSQKIFGGCKAHYPGCRSNA